MSYDLYVERPQGDEAMQLQMLVTREDQRQALEEYLLLCHGKYDKKQKRIVSPPKFNNLISRERIRLQSLALEPSVPDLQLLPAGSWFLQFDFTLAKPWISKDDDPFYVAESVNPVRKDKVFKVPVMSAASWKGVLRWTLMHTRLALKKDEMEPKRFATERFVQTLLFGDEQGEEPAQAKGFSKYVNNLKPEARAEYERMLRQYYKVNSDEPLPHHSGRLMFYPTFFDGIDVEVINPHSRQTKAGKQPIYLECVPSGVQGTFNLLYVPFDALEYDPASRMDEAGKHLRYLAIAIRELFLTYGFSAKRTSGYGVAEDEIDNGKVQTQADEQPLTSLSQLAQEVERVRF